MTLRNQEQALTILARDLLVGNADVATLQLFCGDGIFTIAVWAFDKPSGYARREGNCSQEPCWIRDCGNTNRRRQDICGSETTRRHYQPGLFSGHRSNPGLRNHKLDAGRHSGVCQTRDIRLDSRP